MLCFAIEHDGECCFEIGAQKAVMPVAFGTVRLILMKEG